jgi:hypothetical protein
VLVILVILSVVAIPFVLQTLRVREATQASEDFMNVVEMARFQSSLRGRAYAMLIQPGSGGENGSVRLLEGQDSSCPYDNFVEEATSTAFLEVRAYDFATELPHAEDKSSNVFLESVSPSDMTADKKDGLCFKPDGRVLRVSTESVISAVSGSDYGAGEAVVEIRRHNDAGQAEGVLHRIVVPYNGIPRYTFGSSTEGASGE